MPKAGRGGRGPAKAKKRAHHHELRQFAPTAVGTVPGVAETTAQAMLTPARPVAGLGYTPRRPAGPQLPRRTFSQSIADYSYVVGDLRRIGLLAGGLVALLVALSFVIR